MKFGVKVRIRDSLPLAKFCKNRIRGYTPFGQIYTKNTNFGDFGAVGPYFLSHNGEIWQESAELGIPLPSLIW